MHAMTDRELSHFEMIMERLDRAKAAIEATRAIVYAMQADIDAWKQPKSEVGDAEKDRSLKP